MRWRLIIEEFRPKLTYIKGKSNVVALSRMRLLEKDFSEEAFAGDVNAGDFPINFPLSYKLIAREQQLDEQLQARLSNPRERRL